LVADKMQKKEIFVSLKSDITVVIEKHLDSFIKLDNDFDTPSGEGVTRSGKKFYFRLDNRSVLKKAFAYSIFSDYVYFLRISSKGANDLSEVDLKEGLEKVAVAQ
jgi:hypothetical protein